MSKYIDLTPGVAGEHNIDEGVAGYVLKCLDKYIAEHPDQVPGRTITEGEREGSLEDAPPGFRFGWDMGFAAAGGRIAPDPEPTNAEKLAEIIGDFAIADEHSGQRNDLQLGKLLDARGVKAPGGDDE